MSLTDWDQFGKESKISRTANTVYEGSYSLKFDNANNGMGLVLDKSKSDSPANPAVRSQVYRAADGLPSYIGVVCRFSDTSNFIYVEELDNQIRLNQYDAGSSATLDSISATYTRGQWTQIEWNCYTDNGTFNVEVTEDNGSGETLLGTLKTSSPTEPSGAVGIGQNLSDSGAGNHGNGFIDATVVSY